MRSTHLDVVKYRGEDLLLADPKMRVVVVRVRANVDDAVHVQVQVVEFGDLVLLDDLAEARVTLAEPPVELGHPHTDCITATG